MRNYRKRMLTNRLPYGRGSERFNSVTEPRAWASSGTDEESALGIV
jgi:hypothetical protein